MGIKLPLSLRGSLEGVVIEEKELLGGETPGGGGSCGVGVMNSGVALKERRLCARKVVGVWYLKPEFLLRPLVKNEVFAIWK